MDRINTMVLKFRDVLAQTERLAHEGMAEYQANLLNSLLRHARRESQFYGKRLNPVFRGDDIDLTRWRDIPIVTRAEAQKNSDQMTASILPPHAGPVETEETSGSTGRPLRHRKNELSQVANLAMTDRLFRWWKFDGARAMATFISRRREIAPPPDGTTTAGWMEGKSGPHHLLDMWADTDIQLDWLARNKPAYLTAYSSTLLPLAEAARSRKIPLRLERIVSVATAMSDEIRNICVEVFGTRPIDQYGAQEVGNLACECPHCGHYHVNAEAAMVEILRDDNEPCQPGETGRVIVTSLYNYAMPFIRYEIGDYATFAERSDCAITLPSLSRVVGRYRNTFTLRDGRIIYPYVAIGRFRDFISFDQVQVVQTDYDKIEVRYAGGDKAQIADEIGLSHYLSEALAAPFTVRAVKVAVIERAPSGKFEDFLSLVGRDAAAKPS